MPWLVIQEGVEISYKSERLSVVEEEDIEYLGVGHL